MAHKNEPRGYPGYLPIVVEGLPCCALMDSGNQVASLISEELMKSLGIRRAELRPYPHGLKAANQDRLAVLGKVPKPLTMRVQSLQTVFTFRPLVVQGLNMELNLSGPTMRRLHMEHLHGKGLVKIQGQLTPCYTYQEVKQKLMAQTSATWAYVHETRRLEPRQAAFIQPYSRRSELTQKESVLLPSSTPRKKPSPSRLAPGMDDTNL